jgi:hypothetical protein
VYIKNRPSRSRRAIGFDLCYPSTSKASPNDSVIVIIIIIIVGEDMAVQHRGGIIAQSFCNRSIDLANLLSIGE